jgi:penicillin-binding protein 1A
MKKVTGGTLPALLWHDVMAYAHEDKTPLPLPGAQGARYPEAMAALPWQDTGNSGETPFLGRVLGFFSGR